uniref:Leucine rich adaptor protein 1 n=1 Tax=Gasterosteus aculeatus aculeatus TaxID=481459 RepID=A0AAQ4QIQ1_GASAC
MLSMCSPGPGSHLLTATSLRTWKEMLRGGMAEEILNDSLADLREVENKVGRKTPESLLIWMRDAADCGDGWWSDVVDRGDRSSAFGQSFSDKLRGLKQEMRLLRSADVKILRQLVTVHEGIEAMRWLMEERGASTSRGSSLAGSLSSLVAVEEHGLPLSPCRESQSPSQDLTEDSGEESAGHPPHADDAESSHNGDLRIPESTGEKPPRPRLKFQVTHGSDRRSSPGLANFFVDAKLQKSRPQGSKVAPSQDLEKNAGTIRRALLRSHKARSARDIFSLTKPSEETRTKQQTQSFRVSRNDAKKEEEVAPNGDTSLLGYDAQWCWVDSQDEITYL